MISFESECPYCGKENTQLTEINGEVVKPKDGDVLVCIQCSGLSAIYLDGNSFKLRLMTREEQVEIYRQTPELFQIQADPVTALAKVRMEQRRSRRSKVDRY